LLFARSSIGKSLLYGNNNQIQDMLTPSIQKGTINNKKLGNGELCLFYFFDLGFDFFLTHTLSSLTIAQSFG
jgi:hypothetical protein